MIKLIRHIAQRSCGAFYQPRQSGISGNFRQFNRRIQNEIPNLYKILNDDSAAKYCDSPLFEWRPFPQQQLILRNASAFLIKEISNGTAESRIDDVVG